MSQFTKKAIQKAFLDSILKKSFDKITVKDIVEECEINRNTFYYYYKDIYDLMEDIFIIETQKELEKAQELSSCNEAFLGIAAYIMRYKASISHIYYSKCRDIFVGYLFTMSERILESYIERLDLASQIEEKDKKFVCDFYRFSLVGMMNNWIKNGMEEDEEQFIKKMCDIFENTVEAALRGLTEGKKPV